MGFKFRKSIKIAPGIKLNFSKKSTGITFGGKGVKYTINSKGKRTKSFGIPGTGLYYTTTNDGNKKKKKGKTTKATANEIYINTEKEADKTMNNKKWYQKSWGIILMIILFFPVGIFLMWKYSNWNKIIKIIITATFAMFFLIGMVPEDSAHPSDTDNNTEDSAIMAIVDESETETAIQKQTTTQEYSTTQEQTTVQEYGPTQEQFTTQKQTTAETQTTIQEKSTNQNPATTKKQTTTTKPTTIQKQTTTQKPTTEIVHQPNQTEMVWIPKSGSKYHSHSGCGNMKNPRQVSLEEAKNRGYEPCSKCY